MTDYDRFARFYDLDTSEFQDDIDLYLGFAQRAGGPLLELGCGTGRLLVPLAQAGFEVTGVDISPAMLQIAQRKLQVHGVADRVTLVQADVRTLDLPQRFRMAFMAINSFMHLTSLQDQLQALQAWRKLLLPGALLIIDVDNPHPQLLVEADGKLDLHNRWEDPETGATVLKLVSRSVDPALQLQDIVFIYDEVFPDGQMRRTVAPFQARYVHRAEGELMLDKAGFALEQVYGAYDLAPYTGDSDRLIFVARRR